MGSSIWSINSHFHKFIKPLTKLSKDLSWPSLDLRFLLSGLQVSTCFTLVMSLSAEYNVLVDTRCRFQFWDITALQGNHFVIVWPSILLNPAVTLWAQCMWHWWLRNGALDGYDQYLGNFKTATSLWKTSKLFIDFSEFVRSPLWPIFPEENKVA